MPWRLDWLFQGLDRIPLVAPTRLIQAVVFAAGVLLVVSSPGDWARVGLVEVAASGALLIYYVRTGLRLVPSLWPRFEATALRSLFLEAAPLGAGRLMWAVNQFAATLILAGQVGGDAVAYFAAGHRIVLGLGSFIYLYFFSLYPALVRISDDPGNGLGKTLAASYRLMAWLGIALGLAGSMLAESLCRLLHGDPFEASGGSLTILIWVLPVSLLSGHARFALIASGKQHLEFIAQAAGTFTTLALNLLLIPRFGGQGAAVAMLVAALVIWLVAHAIGVRTISPMPSFGPLLRPLAALTLALTTLRLCNLDSDWGNAALGSSVYFVLGLILERSRLRNLLNRSDPQSRRCENGRISASACRASDRYEAH